MLLVKKIVERKVQRLLTIVRNSVESVLVN